MAGVFRLMNAEADTYRFRFRGLDPAEIYRVKTEPGSLVQTATGAALVNDGLEIRLDSAMTSRLLLVEVAD